MPLIISDDDLKAAGLDENVARVEFACRLFDAGKLTLWQAAQLAGSSRVEFEGELRQRGIPWLRPDEHDLVDDLAALDRLRI